MLLPIDKVSDRTIAEIREVLRAILESDNGFCDDTTPPELLSRIERHISSGAVL